MLLYLCIMLLFVLIVVMLVVVVLFCFVVMFLYSKSSFVVYVCSVLGVFCGVCVLCISGVLCVVCVCGVVGGGGYVIDIFLALCSAGIYILYVFVFGPGTSIVFILLFSYISIICLILFSFSTLIGCLFSLCIFSLWVC